MIGTSYHSTPETKEVLSASKNAMLGVGGEAANLEETTVKQENALALDERTMIGNIIERYKQKNWRKVDIKTKKLSRKQTFICFINLFAVRQHKNCIFKLN